MVFREGIEKVNAMSISVSILVFTLYSGHQDAAMATGWQSYMPTIKHAERSPFAPLTQSHFGKLMDTQLQMWAGDPMAVAKGCRGSASREANSSDLGLSPASPAQ